MSARDAKLIQYLNEAYGKEKELETSLAAHIQMTTRPPYKKRLQEHLRETKRHARDVEKRIKQLGGKAQGLDLPGPDSVTEVASVAQNIANRGVALAKGTGHALRGTSEPEKMLKNAKTEYFNEAEELATYRSIETLAEAVNDKDTAKLARSIIREEERMAKFLERLIPQLTKAVVTEEIPARERRSNGTARRRTASSRSGSTASRSSGSRSSGSSKSGSTRSASSGSGSTRSASSRSGSTRSGGTRAKASSRSGSSSASRSGSSSRSASSRSGSTRASGSRSGGTKRAAASSSRSKSTRSGSTRSGSSRSGGRKSS